MSERFAARRAWLDGALAAIASRAHHAAFVESPSAALHPEGARVRGEAAFRARLGRPFALALPGERGRIGGEVSPYTGEPLGIDYPEVEVEPLYQAARRAMPAFARASVEARVGVGLEILARWAAAGFENAYATMHTTGQGFLMAFTGSGANSLDRGLEALALAYQAMAQIPSAATYTRAFGKAGPVTLDKTYRLHPRGVAVVFTCGTYPAWNAYPAILANLATGNPVVVKPHPGCVLPMAIAVELGRAVLVEAGFSADLLSLAVDAPERPIGKRLLAHPGTAIVDFTGGAGFGRWIEEHCRAQVYTETAGCNAVVLESADDLDAVLGAIGHSMAVFSAQMCTAAQNVFVPDDGVVVGGRRVGFEEVRDRLVAKLDGLTADPAHAAALCGAIMSERTQGDVARLAAAAPAAGGSIARAARPYPHPEFPRARTATPLLVEVDAAAETLYGREHFGPMGFVIRARDRDHALARAADDARRHGAIASYGYSVDPDFQRRLIDGFADAGASVGINLVRQAPINFAAAYSDYHVTGLNPAGTACLADLAFVAARFRITQAKVERPAM